MTSRETCSGGGSPPFGDADCGVVITAARLGLRRSRSKVDIGGTSFPERQKQLALKRARYFTSRALIRTQKFWIYCREGRRRPFESFQSEVWRRLASYLSALPPGTRAGRAAVEASCVPGQLPGSEWLFPPTLTPSF